MAASLPRCDTALTWQAATSGSAACMAQC